VTQQLEFNLDILPIVHHDRVDANGAARGDGDLLAQVRALVGEDGMSPEELQAAIEDALAQGVKWTPEETGVTPIRLRAPACGCDHPCPLPNPWLNEPSCAKCGRVPR